MPITDYSLRSPLIWEGKSISVKKKGFSLGKKNRSLRRGKPESSTKHYGEVIRFLSALKKETGGAYDTMKGSWLFSKGRRGRASVKSKNKKD